MNEIDEKTKCNFKSDNQQIVSFDCVLELKDNVQIFEAIQVDQDQKLFKSVTKSLQNFWFESSRVKELLRNYPEKLTEENLPNVVKWVISEMWK